MATPVGQLSVWQLIDWVQPSNFFVYKGLLTRPDGNFIKPHFSIDKQMTVSIMIFIDNHSLKAITMGGFKFKEII
jgi:hypothetical protein